MTHASTPPGRAPGTGGKTSDERAVLMSGERKLSHKIWFARFSLFWERLWPTLFYPALVASLFVALSWLGLFEALSIWIRVPFVLLFAIGFIASFYGLPKVRFPDTEEGLRRVETISGYRHRPLTALQDNLATGNQDPAGIAMWQAHKRRMAEALKRLHAGYPHPGAFRRDPWGARVVVAILLVMGYTVADGQRGQRLLSAFAGPGEGAVVSGRIDAWVTPPAYTGRAPIFLTGDIGPARDKTAPVKVPEGSVVVIRGQGVGEDYAVFQAANADPVVPVADDEPVDGENNAAKNLLPVEHRIELGEGTSLEVREGQKKLHTWTFIVEPDENPVIALEDDPEAQLSGTLKLTYRITDDYGVVGAQAEVRAAPVDTEGDKGKIEPRPLVEAPQFPLSLPRRSAEAPTAETFRDLTAHAWAGSEILLTLSAEDERGQKGETEPHKMTLPIRQFRKPLAKAIVEQRRNLAMDANRHAVVIDSMDALMMAPEKFIKDTSYYVGMRFVYKRLVTAQSDEDLLEVVDLLWELALTVEDGDLSMAERALRDAQEALRKALEEGASDEEIAKLTQELREALQRYMQALAEQMRQNPQAMQPMDPNAQALRAQDLDEMLRRIEELAKSGSRDAAQQLLSQMQQMLENLQNARPQMMPPSEGMQEMMEALNQLGEMIQRQQELMDQTFQHGQQNPDDLNRQGQRDPNGARRPGEPQQPMSPEELAEALKNLQQQQGDLAQRLQEMMQKMQENGMNPGEELGQAGESMGDAQQSLGQGETGDAVGEQGEALDSLRRGAQQLSEQMMNQNGQSGMAQGNRQQNQDPLGRPRRTEGPDFGANVKVPDEIDVQRARRILEELRRRFSDPERPSLELDYIERLLNPF
ncbi:MAG: TIGR02302 family protein [Stappiaceae bacterium]